MIYKSPKAVQQLDSMLLSSTADPKITFYVLICLKTIEGQRSFMHVTLRWKFQSQECQSSLRYEDILPYKKNIAIRIFGPLHFLIVKFHEKCPLKSAIWNYKINITCIWSVKLHEKWPLKSVIWSYKIKIIGLWGIKLHKKVKSN